MAAPGLLVSAAVKVLGFVIVAAVLVGGALFVLDRDPAPPARPHVAIAPGKSVPGRDGQVAGTTLTAQDAADAAIEDGRKPDLVPLSAHDFDAPIARYRAYAVKQARALIQAADRRDFGEAFDRWLLVGAVYGALGDLETDITASIHDRDGARLSAAARRLPGAVRRAKLEPVDYAIRAHEILEDVQRDTMGVRATADGVAVTRTVIGTLRTVLSGRGDVLPQVDSRLLRLSETLQDIHRAHGGWPRTPTRAEREQLSGRLGAALEALAGVPGALETSLPPKIPVLK